jgi:hypothetical protein
MKHLNDDFDDDHDDGGDYFTLKMTLLHQSDPVCSNMKHQHGPST